MQIKSFMKSILITTCIILFTLSSKAQKQTVASLTNVERKSIVKALHLKFKEETDWKFVVRQVSRKTPWAIIKVTPQQIGNNYETMIMLVKQTGKTWKILETQDPSAGEDGEPTFAQVCIKKYPTVPKTLFK